MTEAKVAETTDRRPNTAACSLTKAHGRLQFQGTGASISVCGQTQRPNALEISADSVIDAGIRAIGNT